MTSQRYAVVTNSGFLVNGRLVLNYPDPTAATHHFVAVSQRYRAIALGEIMLTLIQKKRGLSMR